MKYDSLHEYRLYKYMILAVFIVIVLSFCDEFASYAATKTDDIYHTDSYIDEDEEGIISKFTNIADVTKVSDDIYDITKKYDMNGNVSFEDLYNQLVSGNIDEALSMSVTIFCGNITYDLLKNREIIVQLVMLIIFAAVFTNYSSILKFSYVGEQGFYITYMMCASLLIKSFSIIYNLAEQTVKYVKELMECILPAFSMSLIMCGGLTTSQMTNSFFVWMLSLMERILLNVILPTVRIYFLIILFDQISSKERFSKLGVLIKQGLDLMLKGLIAGVAGVNVVKGMIAPVYENVKFNAIQKGVNMLPGGGDITGLTSIFIGTGVLIKNSIGVAGAVILLFLGAIPLVKILIFYVSYRLVLAFTQPISDKRIISGVEAACGSTEIMFRCAATSIALCILSIAIILLSTNVRLYVG